MDKQSRANVNIKIPRTHKPEGMTLEEWQTALRREFGAVQNFKMENVGNEPIFSEFIVSNPTTGGNYRIAIRGETPGINYCSCPDYSVNTLGTCKHIEFTLARLRRKRGAKAVFRKGFQPAYSSVYLQYGQKREAVFKPGTQCPKWLSLLASQYFDQNGFLKPESFSRFDVFLKRANMDGHELRCYEDAIRFIAQVRDDERRNEIIDKKYPDGIEGKALDNLLKISMYPYQRKGALFAAKAGRSIIADDMGLGKTIQAIAACEILAHASGIERAMIICPTSLKHQWEDEIKKFSGRKTEVIQGLFAARKKCYETDSFFKIANYDVVHRDMEFIRKWNPDVIILDEAQRIKNWKTRRAQSVKKLESPYTIVLTGTPLENRLEELHSIVEFVDRFRLGPLFRFLHEHQITDDDGKVVGYQKLTRISKSLEPILIRRTKDEVLKQLPERLDKKFFVTMTKEQLTHHEENRDVVARLVAKWRRYHFLSDTDQRRLQIALQNMRMSCNSTYLLDQSTDFGQKADEAISLMEEIFEQPDIKIVVFSQWLRTHELLIRRIEAKKWNYVLFHGGVPGPQRKNLIKEFRENPQCRLFLSTDAGGLGLNLQFASVVINMDQPWNPAVLEQRIGRVHRLGQHRPVRVIHYIADRTIEHGMLSLLAFKKSLFSGVLDKGEDEIFLGGTRLKQFIESVEKITGAIPEPAPEQEPQAAMEKEGREEVAVEETKEIAKDVREQTWTDVATAGLALLEKLGQALVAGQKEQKNAPDRGITSAFIERDQTGQPYLKLPMPRPETLQKIADLLYELAGKR